MRANRFILLLAVLAAFSASDTGAATFRAGAIAIDIAPTNYPVIVNGGFLEKTATKANDPLYARALALDDGSTRLVICVVDTCMMPGDLIDRAKDMAQKATGLPADRMLVSATHTHSAPSSMACLGSRADTNYVQFLPGKIAEAIVGAIKNLEPASIGWAAVDDWEHTFNRRWIRRPDKLITDPYGQASAKAHMHPGHQSPDAIGPSGPVDPGLSLLAVKAKDGRPLGLLANYSQHYFGAPALSADYYGRFAEHIAQLIGAKGGSGPFVGIMSQGTSGDLMWMDYAAPRRQISFDTYAKEVADHAFKAYQKIQWRDWVPLKMTEKKLPLAYRVPDADRLAWARKVAATVKDRLPNNWPEVYAFEALHLHERQRTELKLQALRIGELGIATLPNEVYAITGLKLKAQSPLAMTFNIELANGAEGYIPPPEQHALGGYTTWAARTAGLEVQAESRIVETLLTALEEVAGQPRKPVTVGLGNYAKAILSGRPAAFWRLEEMVFPTAQDSSGNKRPATYENGIALYLAGAGSGTGITPKPALTSSEFSAAGEINRAAHFAGGRLNAKVKPGKQWSAEFWLWNGLVTSLRGTTGILLATDDAQEQLGITGNSEPAGRLFFSQGTQRFVGKTELQLKEWHQVALVRDGDEVRVYLDGRTAPEITGTVRATKAQGLFFGGATNEEQYLEGKLDEIAYYDRVLKPEEFAAHWKISGIPQTREREAAEKAAALKLELERANPPKFPASYREAVAGLKPSLVWSLNEAKDATVPDVSANKRAGRIEGNVTVQPVTYAAVNGGRIRGEFKESADHYSVSFWFRNNSPNDAQAVTAYLFSRGPNGNNQAPGDHLGIGGTYRNNLPGRLMFFNGNAKNQVLSGNTILPSNTWNHVVLVRAGKRVTAWLNGVAEPEISGEAEVTTAGVKEFFLGARSDNFTPLNGYLAEFALFERALTATEATQLHKASGQVAGTAKQSPPAAVTPPPASLPLAPAAALKSIKVREGYRVELVAAEPLTMDPVAIDWDLAGRLWVVEMADYPLGMDGNGKSGGRVRVLEDTNGDGRYDKSTVFAEGLNFPTGLLTWRDGVIVTAAPDILFLRDTNGDGKADERKVLFTGFFEGNQQLRVNGLRWGLDNWVYCANGGHTPSYGSKVVITSKLTGKGIELGSRDFRFQPDTGELEPESGPTQFGRNRDDWGNWFGTQNSWPLWHYVLSDRYLRRNPYVASPSPLKQVVTPGNPKVYPVSSQEKRFHSFDQAGRFTSACAGMIYQDEWLFSDGYRHAFTSEPFHNLVQHNILTDEGTSFGFHRAPEEAKHDFFASEDRWCRPVMTRTGPDGALWVVDMYRYMIEHPAWLPANGKSELLPHYRLGDDMGRIYRVVTDKSKAQSAKFKGNLSGLSGGQLVALLDDSNGWLRDKVQQALIWRADKSVAALLEQTVRKGSSPQGRLQALATLDGLQALKPELVAQALADAHPGVLIHALRLAETHGSPAVIQAATKLVTHSDAKVRLQMASSLGEWKDASAGVALAQLVIKDRKDVFILAAAMSSAVPHGRVLVEAVSQESGAVRESLTEPLLNVSLGINDRDSVAKLLAPSLSAKGGVYSEAQLAAFSRFLDILARGKKTLSELQKGDDGLAVLLKQAEALFAFARQGVADKKRPLQERAAAVELLAREPSQRTQVMELLNGWLTPQMPGEAQRVAIKALASTGDDRVPGLLLEHWAAFAPETRNQVLEALFTREAWLYELLKRVKVEEVSPMVFDAARRAQLQRHQAKRVQDLAKEVFKAGASSRAQVVEQFRQALALKGDVKRGQAVYAKLCITCHKTGDQGNEIGPDLRSVVAHPPEKLLVNILDPSSDVQPGFFAYSCTLKSGDEFYGLITSETGNSITMKLADGTTRAIVRNDIASLRGSNLSLMPEGLEAGLSAQELADLIQYLRTER